MTPADGARFLVGALVVGLVLYGLWLLLSMFPVPEPFRTIILIIFILVGLGILVNWSGLWRGWPPAP